MGIRFYCPNKHKLNVKEFQAGRIGICPYCGVKVQIPLSSTRPSTKHHDQPQAVETGRSVAMDAAPAAIGQQAASLANAAPAPVARLDPLVEGGMAVWYVRPPSGGQFGPAVADVMRVWLAEGRVSADTFVWREGWRDWMEAGDVFPQLLPSTLQGIPELETALAEPSLVAFNKPPKNTRERTRIPRIAIFLTTALIAAVIVAVLFLVARR